MPRAKQCPSYPVIVYKSKDFHCYQKGTGFCSFQTISKLPYQWHDSRSFRIWNLLVAYQNCNWTFQNFMPKWKKAFLLSYANYKTNRSPLPSPAWLSWICTSASAGQTVCALLWFPLAVHSHMAPAPPKPVLLLDWIAKVATAYGNFHS